MNAKKNAKPKSADRRLLKSPRGQAMVEYSIVSHFILVGGAFAMMEILPRFFKALTTYYESIFFVLSTAAV